MIAMSVESGYHRLWKRNLQHLCNPLYRGAAWHYCTLVVLLYMQVGVRAQSQDIARFSIFEEKPSGSEVGKLPVKVGLKYYFQSPSSFFTLDPTNGKIVTALVIDREKLGSKAYFDIAVFSSSTPKHVIEVHIDILDINDHSPEFKPASTSVRFKENNPTGPPVILDTATDEDFGSNGIDVTTYRIVDGNSDNLFSLFILPQDRHYLYLGLNRSLDREIFDQYALKIGVRDGGNPTREGFLTVQVQVEDDNDNPPLFDHSDYSAVVNETAPTGTSIITLGASDKDTGVNGQIVYKLADGHAQFAINPVTGVVSTQSQQLRCPIKCDETCVSTCILTVVAEDRGEVPLTGRAYLTVTLRDQNDHAPVITFKYPKSNQQYATVPEGHHIVNHIAFVSVTDADTGKNGETKVRIIHGNERRHFTLIEGPGFRFIKGNNVTIDRELVSRYNLTLEAQDSGEPPKMKRASLIIHVMDINDHKPVFKQRMYVSALSEGAPLGSFVASISATDGDSGLNSKLTYAIIEGNQLNWLTIHPATGLVTTHQKLDYETAKKLVVTVRSKDSGSSPNESRVTLSVTILDENDEVPKFTQSVINVTKLEGFKSHSLLTTVKAHDLDSGINGTVEYDLLSEQEAFNINRQTGLIKTLVQLDAERKNRYVILVRAKDLGSPPLSSTASVVLTVVGVNDNNPVIYPKNYYVNIKQHTPILEQIVWVRASDRDSDASLRYQLSGGNGKFSLGQSSGLITLAESLIDVKLYQQFKLTVSVTDQGGRKASDAHVHITVIDDGEIAPKFSRPKYKFSVKEDDGRERAAVGHLVGQISLLTESSVTYMIFDGDPNGHFHLESKTGVITTALPLDREHIKSYTLEVVAQASFVYQHVIVDIEVVDVNDNRPSVSSLTHEIFIVHNAPQHTKLFVFAAVDLDKGENGRLTYTAKKLSSNFEIDTETGIVSLSQSLHQTHAQSFSLHLQARDHGDPPLYSDEMHLRISMQNDVSTIRPIFDMNSVSVAISEDALVNYQFYNISAAKDSPTKLTYSIVEGNSDGRVGILPSGKLYVAQRMDRETTSEYLFTIRAEEQETKASIGIMQLSLRVVDTNDESPIYSDSTRNLQVSEGAPSVAYVGRLHASDQDEGINCAVTYRLQPESPFFRIDELSGIITTKVSLDREEFVKLFNSDVIDIAVIAEDNGIARNTVKALLSIRIIDENDSPPRFEHSFYATSVSENANVNTPLLRVSATDKDVGKNAACQFSILSGNEENKFRMMSDGQILLASKLDREDIDEYWLLVEVANRNQVDFKDIAKIHITVQDYNDCYPTFDNSNVKILVSEDVMPGDYITSIIATDSDLGVNSLLSYQINSDFSNFAIDANNGNIYLQSKLDFIQRKSYMLNVTANDHGTPQRSSWTSLEIVVLDSNNHAPSWSVASYIWFVRENTGISSPIGTVYADDKDSGLAGTVAYKILRQEPSLGLFIIDSEKGIVSTAGLIDREAIDSHILYIRAVDQVKQINRRRYSDTKVVVKVSDANDNDPKFISPNAVAVLLGTPKGTIIHKLKATDLDTGVNAVLSFELVSGDKSRFEILKQSGEVKLLTSLRGLVPTYVLKVAVKDGGGRISTQLLTIVVTASVENGPLFDEKKYSAKIYEGEKAASHVVRITAAYIPDDNRNINYYLTDTIANSQSAAQVFNISTEGDIRNIEPLDRDNGISSYSITAYAVDHTSAGTPRTRQVQIDVTILDRNDSPPVFTNRSYQATILESVGVGAEVLRVFALDADIGGRVRYSLEPKNDFFEINANTGLLSVSRLLDREKDSDYSLMVVASDGVQSSEASIHLKVQDVNDERPTFTQSWYAFSVNENARLGTTIGRVWATDNDEGMGGIFSFFLRSIWGRDKFNLNSQTGVITLTGSLDYEQVDHYVLQVHAQDNGEKNTLSSSVSVYINIKDVNDNAPMFNPSSYSGQVTENSTVGTTVLKVAATDMDSGQNGNFEYRISRGDLNGQFLIDSLTGAVKVLKLLDRENQSSYQLEILAIDKAEHQPKLTSTTMANIRVEDVNDNAPVFNMPESVGVYENILSHETAFKVKATDIDTGRNAQLKYEITSNSDGRFRVDSASGNVYASGSLDREYKPWHNITITAFDNGEPLLSASAVITVEVLDRNDNSPQLKTTEYSTAIKEDTPVGTSVLWLEASDSDDGRNAALSYFIQSGDAARDFSIDSRSGILRVRSPLDYERKKSYIIHVVVQDLGLEPKTDRATLTISIEDVNDCSPEFVHYSEVKVMENVSSLPVFITKATARDLDSTQLLRYSLQEGDRSLFSVNYTTGDVFGLKRFDREKIDHYKIVIKAVDSGVPQLTGTGTLTVFVSDDNDNHPIFARKNYAVWINEDVDVRTTVITVVATDKDEGRNAMISYSLEPKTPLFDIDATGTIRTKTLLDREEKAQYLLKVVATDGGVPPLSSTTLVNVILTDVNDNKPHFTQKMYNRIFPRPISGYAVRKGEFVCGVLALDADFGENAVVTYNLEGIEKDKFSINPKTGVITAVTDISHRSATLALSVRATDTKLLSSEANITISFSSTEFYKVQSYVVSEVTLSEDTDVGRVVANVTPNSINVQNKIFEIAAGNTGNSFIITKQGIIKLHRSLDYENTKMYDLRVSVRKASSRVHLEFHQLTVKVEDRNDCEPQFLEQYYNVSLQENEWPPQRLATVQAVDRDSGNNGKVNYELLSHHRLLDINPTSGVITTKSIHDREEIEQYTVLVKAFDQGDRSLSSTATMDVYVIDKNDNPPIFTTHFVASINENSPIGTEVLRITSTDKDIGSNTLHSYKLSNQEKQKFSINASSGVVTVHEALDTEENSQHTLTVEAYDGAYEATTTISIDVKDVNDNAPIFTQQRYKWTVVEGSTRIGQVQASDRDATQPNREVFYLLASSTPNFLIDVKTGHVVSNKPLAFNSFGNSTEVNSHHLIIRAQDRGKPALMTDVSVEVVVVRRNVHAPLFEEQMYTIPVAADTLVDTHLFTFVATDADGDNISYQAVQGNGTFVVNIDNNGRVLLVRRILQNIGLSFVVIIRAIDTGTPAKQSQTSVKLLVVAPNHNRPVFMHSTFNIQLAEGFETTDPIAQVKATDSDTGQNGQVHYILYNMSDLFHIDRENGKLYLKGQLDYESKQVHELNISARDRGLIWRETFTIFTITVTDIVDNPPKFHQAVHKVAVPENCQRDKVIYTLVAAKVDSVGTIQYYLTGNADALTKFAINPINGQISCIGSLDYELTTSFQLSVKALKPGKALSTSTSVLISVVDVNEFAPLFIRRSYTFVISEDSGVGSSVGKVSATDGDKGDQGTVRYALIGDSNLKSIDIDTHNGLLTISKPIDRELQDKIIVEVLAYNRGSVNGHFGNNSTALVQIRVSDSNDAPKFTSPIFYGRVLETAIKNERIVKVTAADSDVKASDKSFFFRLGNHSDTFQITSTGWLLTSAKLDRESIALYYVAVLAIDTGKPPKTGTTIVKVEVDDFNDRAPYFIPRKPVLQLTENMKAFSESTVALATFTYDDDLNPNKGPFKYYLITHTHLFSVGIHNGVVQAKTPLDREVIAEYEPVIRVEDNGAPLNRMTSTLTFLLRVKDENDEPSKQRPLTITTYVYNETKNSGKLADIKPMDKDLVGDYNCKISGIDANSFFISKACDLSIKSSINEGSYKLHVTGSDGKHGSVEYPLTIYVHQLKLPAIQNSVVLRLFNAKESSFLEERLSTVTQTINSGLGKNEAATIYSAVNSDIRTFDLYLFVSTTFGYLDYQTIITKLASLKPSLLSATGAQRLLIGFNNCTLYPNYCGPDGICKTSIVVDPQLFNSFGTGRRILASTMVSQQSSCTCSEDFSGNRCETPLRTCQRNICKNGGTCAIRHQREMCVCSTGWQGFSCEDDVNECNNVVCLNGGKCSNTMGSFLCHCPMKFVGKRCQYADDLCSESRCYNGGQCIHANNEFSCQCRFGTTGKLCEISSLTFEELSFREYHMNLNSMQNDISLEFATLKKYALLMFAKASQSAPFMALELIDGKPMFSFRLGHESNAYKVSVNVNVATGNFFRVIVHRRANKLTVRVDNCTTGHCIVCNDKNCAATTVQGPSDLFSTQLSTISIGGVRLFDEILKLSKYLHAHDFTGCIRNVVVEGIDIMNLEAAYTNGTTLGCQRSSERSLCEKPNICGEASHCVDEWLSYRCKCAPQRIGSRCEDQKMALSFGRNAMLVLQPRLHYIRDTMLSSAKNERQKRTASIVVSTLSITFATTKKTGVLFYSEEPEGYTIIQLTDGKVRYSNNKGVNIESDVEVDNGAQYNMSVVVRRHQIVLKVGVQELVYDISKPGPDPLSMQLSEISLGGTKKIVLPFFEGCIVQILFNGFEPTWGGVGDRFVAQRIGQLAANGCDAVISNVNKDTNLVLIGAVVGVIGALAVLAAFAVLIVCLRHKQKQKQSLCRAMNGNGDILHDVSKSAALDKSSNDSQRSRGDSGYNEPIDGETQIINQHIKEEMETRRSGRRDLSTPDLVSQNTYPDTVFARNQPVEYDFDNASSIAPSDLVDVSKHYKDYRRKHARRYQPEQSRGIQCSSTSSSPLTVGTVNDLSRRTPTQQVHSKTPISQLGPNLVLEPRQLTHSPLNIHGLRPSSASSAEWTSATSGSRIQLPHGLTHNQVKRLNTRTNRRNESAQDAQSSDDEGILATDLNLINKTDFTHADLLKPDPCLLPPPDTSTDESDNDTFTCSEVDYEPSLNRPRMNDRDFNYRMPLSKLPELDESMQDVTDTDVSNVRSRRGHDSDTASHRSVSTFFSDDELCGEKRYGNKLPTGVFSWDYLLNWGPNFQGLVGVFTDLALLPDGNQETPPPKYSSTSRSHNGRTSVPLPPYQQTVPSKPRSASHLSRPYLKPSQSNEIIEKTALYIDQRNGANKSFIENSQPNLKVYKTQMVQSKVSNGKTSPLEISTIPTKDVLFQSEGMLEEYV